MPASLHLSSATSLPARRRAPAGGYSLAEVLVTLAVFTGILAAVLVVFNLNYRLARGRTATAAAQAALRSGQVDVERLVRRAGRGGLAPALAISVRDDVAAGATVGGPGTAEVVAGTDVLTVRGVFSTPLFRVRADDATLRPAAGGEAGSGAIVVRDPSPQTGARQELGELALAIEARGPRGAALLLVGPFDEAPFAVVEILPAASGVERFGDRLRAVTVAFRAAGAAPALAGGGDLAAVVRDVAYVGILEEYRLFVRRAFSTPGDERSRPRPQLSLARFAPGTDEPDPGSLPTGGVVDLAPNVFDLQAALGIDIDGDGLLSADRAHPAADEWLFNDPGDDPAAPRWTEGRAGMRSIRITIRARDRPPAGGGRTLPPLESIIELRPPGAAPRAGGAAAP